MPTGRASDGRLRAMSTPSAFELYRREGRPFMRESAVLFLDVLGTGPMSSSLDELGDDDDEGRTAHVARLCDAWEEARELAGDDHGRSHATSYFSDSVAVSLPYFVNGQHPEDVNTEFFWRAASLQTMLVHHGFLSRGGVSVGWHYADERIVYGPAQTRAVKLEEDTADMPRIALDPTFVALERKHMKFFGDGLHAPQRFHLLVEGDLHYVNYLGVATRWIIDNEGDVQHWIRGHRDGLVRYWNDCVERAGDDPLPLRPRKKIEWSLRYHNWFCTQEPLGADLVITPAAVAGADIEPLEREFVPYGENIKPIAERHI